MSNDATIEVDHGAALYAYLSAYWRAHGTNQNAWCDAHPGIQAPTVSRWARGTEPSLSALRKVADALGISMLDILIAADVITEAELDRPAPAAPAAPSFLDAVRLDPDLTDREREIYPEMRAAFAAVTTGRADEVARNPRPTSRRRNVR
jgi:transcriptional regulator with XRE-family HTH domain